MPWDLTQTGLDGRYGLREEIVNVANSGTAYTIPDTSAATAHLITLTGNCTFTFPTAAAGKSFSMLLVQDATGSRIATWPGTVRWLTGSAPTLQTAASARDEVSFRCYNGTNWEATSAR